jgi:hypothetical protein
MVASGVTGCYTILNLNRERTMNGTTDNTGNCRTGNRSGGDNLNDRNEATEYERRRKLVEEARKHLLSVQKV